jgi:hypothetical protein
MRVQGCSWGPFWCAICFRVKAKLSETKASFRLEAKQSFEAKPCISDAIMTHEKKKSETSFSYYELAA